MKIAIIGSWRESDADEWHLRDKQEFFKAVNMLGGSLVEMGHRLVVATDAQQTADRAAVDGAVHALPRKGSYTSPVIELLQGRRPTYSSLMRERPGFVSLAEKMPTAEVAKLHQVQIADVVFAAGGAEKTLQAIIAAAASGKRIVPVACFGGAAEKARTIMKTMSATWGPNVPSDQVLGTLATAWSPPTNELILHALGVRHPRLLIIHGRDTESCKQLQSHIRELGLPDPVVMALEPDRGAAIPEKFEQLAVHVDAAIALVTPDDVGRLGADEASAMRSRARQNVWVEVGWFWGRLDRSRVLLLGKGDVEMPSDLSGLMVKRFHQTPAERSEEIRQWIESMGWPRPGGELRAD